MNGAPPTNVRFWGQSGHASNIAQCPLLTQSGHQRVPRFPALFPFIVDGILRGGLNYQFDWIKFHELDLYFGFSTSLQFLLPFAWIDIKHEQRGGEPTVP
jgi:hypothetical protein